jgi:hypothetical protein
MTRPFRESTIERGLNHVRVEEGRIVNVNTRRFTCDVRTLVSQRTFLDLTWGSPYFHFSRGEGFNSMPEVGAKVKVCRPSDADPFILCFVTPFERIPAEEDGDQAADQGDTEVTYQAGRPFMQEGDIQIRGRDGNELYLHRGGVLEIGATAACRRFYIPLLNYLRDVCENYALWTQGGQLTWLVSRADENASGESHATLAVVGKEAAEHEQATVAVKLGRVDDDKRFELVVAPQALNAVTGDLEGEAVYHLSIDQEGSVTLDVAKNVNLTVGGDLEGQIEGSATLGSTGDVEVTCGANLSTNVSGRHELEAASSTERINGQKVIQSNSILLGSQSAAFSVVLATPALISFLAAHTHQVIGPQTGPPTPSMAPNMYQARKVRGE